MTIFTKIINGEIPSYKVAENEHFYAFLARITRNLSLNAIRNRNRIKRSAKLTDITNEFQYCLPVSEDADVSLDEKLLVDSIGKYLKSVSKEKRIMNN